MALREGAELTTVSLQGAQLASACRTLISSLISNVFGVLNSWCVKSPFDTLDGLSGVPNTLVGIEYNNVRVFSGSQPSAFVIFAAQSAMPVGQYVRGVGVHGS